MRTVNISLSKIPNQPIASARVSFRPLKKGQATTSDVWPSLTHSVTTDANGDATLQLPTGIEIEVTLPDGWRGTIVVPSGATPIDLSTLLLGNATPPNNWQTLLDAHEQKIAGVGPSGVLGHVRVDGTTVTVNPSTGVISAAGGGGAPANAQYIVAAADPTLTAERVATNTTTVEWDFTVAGQARASVVDGSIDTTQLANNAVTGPKIAPNAVTASKIASSAVTTPKIQDGAVLYSKIQDVTPNRLLGRGATAGPPEEIQIGTNLSLSGGTLSATGGATNLGYIPAPTSGQVTSSTGTPATIPQADTTNAGLLNPTDKNKLNHYQLDTAPAQRRVQIGQSNQSGSGFNTSFGVDNQIYEDNNVVIGSNTVIFEKAVAIGNNGRANPYCVSVGHQAFIQFGNSRSIAIGYNTFIGHSSANTIAIGSDAFTLPSINGSFGLGARASISNSHAGVLAIGSDQSRPANTLHRLLVQISPNDNSTGRYAGGFVFRWLDNVVATRRGRVDVVACDAASDERVGLTVDSTGTQPRVSVLGATPIARTTAPAAATDLASAITLVNALRQLMIDFGLWEV